MPQRRDKTNYYLDIAQTVASRSTCLRRGFGAILVKNDSILSTGYVGAPRGRANCCDLGVCARIKLGIPQGERYELCRSVHAEANAIINAPREQMIGSTLYLACVSSETGAAEGGTRPCSMCRRLIINAGIKTVVVRDDASQFRTYSVYEEWVAQDDPLGAPAGY